MIETNIPEPVRNTTAHDVKVERDKCHKTVRNLGSGSAAVDVRWNTNKACAEDHIVTLSFQGKEILVRAEELRKAIRWA